MALLQLSEVYRRLLNGPGDKHLPVLFYRALLGWSRYPKSAEWGIRLESQ